MRAAILFVVVAVFVSASGCQNAAGPMDAGGTLARTAPLPASGIEVRLPDAGFVAGETGQIEIRLIDAEGQPAKTTNALTLELSNAEALGLPPTIELQAGSAGVDVALTPQASGLASLEVHARQAELDAGYATVATLPAPLVAFGGGVEPEVEIAIPKGAFELARGELAVRSLKLDELRARPQGSWGELLAKNSARGTLDAGEEDSQAVSPTLSTGGEAEPTSEPPAPQEPPTTPTSPTSPTLPTPTLPAEGHIELVASPAQVVCGAGGWRPAKVDAYWKVGDRLAKTSEAIEISLTTSGNAGSIEPSSLTIPAAGFKSAEPAWVEGRVPGQLAVAARFAGSAPAEPLAIDIVAEPGKLAVEAAEEFAGLAVTRESVTIRLVDPRNPAVALPIAKPLKVDLILSGPGGTRPPQTVILDPDKGSGSATLEIDRHGKYSVSAQLACLESTSRSFRYVLDWAMIGMAAGAGLLGSVLSYKPRSQAARPTWQKFGWVALGAAVAGLLALMLSSFGLLSFLEKVIPFEGLWAKLDELPAMSFSATALTGFFAGFFSDKLWAKFRSR